MTALTNFYKGKIDMQKVEIGFDKTNTFPIMVKNMFRAAPDGQLEHWMDDKLRATVPPESWDAYCKEWPAAREVCDSLLLPRTETPEQALQKAVAAMLNQSQQLNEGTEIIMPAEQLTEDADHAE